MSGLNIDPRKYPSNSTYNKQNNQSGHARNGNKPKPKQLVSNNAMARRKKSLMEEFKDSFITNDKIDIGTYLVKDVVVPTIQNTILDYLSMRFFGASQAGRNRGYGYGKSIFDYGREVFGYGNRTNYGGSYNYGRQTGGPNLNNPDRRIDYHDIILLNAQDAKTVVDYMRNRIMRYNEATVSDLFSCIGITSAYTDDDWGWTNPSDIGIKRVPEGWLIDVADAIYLNR